MESLLPIVADSVVERYERYEPGLFYATYGDLVRGASAIVDSLNRSLPGSLRIDTLAIDHTFESLGEAARRGRTLYLSSSYFYLYENLAVIRSVIWHEFGHVYYARLSARRRMNMEEIWQASRATAMFYVFRDGEYSRNARFGGHPEDSPEELFASAFNLFANNPDEVTARTGYLTSREADIVQRLREVVERSFSRALGPPPGNAVAPALSRPDSTTAAPPMRMADVRRAPRPSSVWCWSAALERITIS